MKINGKTPYFEGGRTLPLHSKKPGCPVFNGKVAPAVVLLAGSTIPWHCLPGQVCHEMLMHFKN
jgi:hypothetical protein